MKATVNTPSLNRYKVVWVEFRAIRGIVTKKDIRVLDCPFWAKYRKDTTGRYWMAFGSLESAEKHCKGIDQTRLTKQYEVRYCYEVQFSRGIVNPVTHINTVKFTRKQEEEKQVIGPNK